MLTNSEVFMYFFCHILFKFRGVGGGGGDVVPPISIIILSTLKQLNISEYILKNRIIKGLKILSLQLFVNDRPKIDFHGMGLPPPPLDTFEINAFSALCLNVTIC